MYRVYFARTMRIFKKFKKLPRNAAAISVAAGLLPNRGWYQMEKWRIRCRITFSFTKNTNTNTNTRKRKQ